LYNDKTIISRESKKESGVTIHYVNQYYDQGAIIHQEKCPVEPDDTPTDLSQKVQKLEHSSYPLAIENIIRKSGK